MNAICLKLMQLFWSIENDYSDDFQLLNTKGFVLFVFKSTESTEANYKKSYSSTQRNKQLYLWGKHTEKWKKIVGQHCHKIANEKEAKRILLMYFISCSICPVKFSHSVVFESL